MRLATSVRIQDPLGFFLQSLLPPPAEAGFGVDAGKRNKESRGGERTGQKKTLKKRVFILSTGKKGKLMLTAEGSGDALAILNVSILIKKAKGLN